MLKKYIIEYNLNAIESSLKDNTYRGEEGILRINPETADSMGIEAFIDQDYRDAKRLLEEAEEAMEKAQTAMVSQKTGSLGYYSEIIAENFLIYKRYSQEAEKKLMSYHSRLGPEMDERFDPTVCEPALDSALEKSLAETNYRLRDGLAYFFNFYQGINSNPFPLNTKNVDFVNYVFNAFLEHAPEEEKVKFDLDRDIKYREGNPGRGWKGVAYQEIPGFVDLLEKAVTDTAGKVYDVDPLLFIALMKKESSFNPLAVSGVGAAGLTQIMPRTAKDMGLEDIYLPEYYDEAVGLLKNERSAKRSAMTALFKISPDKDDNIEYAKQAREFMQESLELGSKRLELYKRYKKDLLKKKTDPRLDPEQAIEYGLKYFARQMRAQEGDISLALASYNAGPHRIKVYQGIPPYEETVGFRNRILHYYKEYLREAETK